VHAETALRLPQFTKTLYARAQDTRDQGVPMIFTLIHTWMMFHFFKLEKRAEGTLALFYKVLGYSTVFAIIV
jgi:hypothetical protein